MIKKYHGVIPAIISPVNEDETIDVFGYQRLLDYCIEGGLHGIFAAGTNGETLALTQSERNKVIKVTLDHVNGRVPVIAGVMDSSTKRVVENIKALEDMGGTCVAVTSIFYDRHTSQDVTIRHFEKILKETNVDVFVYNIPPFTGIKLTPATVIKIAGLDDRIVGYKDSSGAYAEFLQVVAKFKNTPFSCLQGITGTAMSSLLMGADGYVPALAPAFPRLFADSYEAAISGDLELTYKYNNLIMETSKLLGMTINATAATKYAISLRGFTDKRVIYPQDTIQPHEEEMISQKVAEIDSIYASLKSELKVTL
jgi:4-hydroxy-tetrahydrodipicolinate synthase